MSAKYNYNFKRWSLRGKSDLMSITAMPAMTTLAYERMAAAAWLELAETDSDLPRHDPMQVGAWADTYDAAKFCTDYANGKQYAFACAACYTIKIPAEAQAGTKAKVEAVIATVYGDRWLGEGAIISAFLTASATPPAWADIIDGSTALASSPDPAPAADAVTVPDWRAPLRQITRSNTAPDNDYAATLTPATATDATAYLHVVIRLSDYISVRQISATDGGTRDSAWIEGGAKIDGTTLAVQFDRAVTADAGEVLMALAQGWDRSSDSPLAGPPCYDVDLHLAYYRQNSTLLTGAPHYRSLIERMRWTPSMLNGTLTDGSAEIISRYDANLIHTALNNGKAGFFKSTATGYTNCNYAISWVLYGRTVLGGKTVSAISFPDASIAAPTAGLTYRLSVFGAAGGYSCTDTYSDNSAKPSATFPPHMISAYAATDPLFYAGESATPSLKFIQLVNAPKASVTYHQQHNMAIESALSAMIEIGATVPLTRLASIDVTAALAAGTQIQFDAPWAVPQVGVVYVALAPIAVTSEYTQSPDTADQLTFRPRDFHLHVV